MIQEDSSTLSSIPTQSHSGTTSLSSSRRRPTITDEFHLFLTEETRSTAVTASLSSSSTRHHNHANNANVAQLTVNKLRYSQLEEMTDSPKSEAPLGRSREHAILAEKLKDVVEGRVGRQLVLLSGYSGVGKTKLASSIRPLVNQERGLFVMSKFDYNPWVVSGGESTSDSISDDEGFNRDTTTDSNPYVAITTAFNRVCRDIYRRRCTNTDSSKDTPDVELDRKEEIDTKALRQHLMDAMTPTELYLLEEIVPDLDLLLVDSDSNPVATTDNSSQFATDIKHNTETKPILLHAFRKLMRIIAYHARVLCIVLDDMQWTDSASLGILKVILSDEKIKNLMVVACHRSNEVGDAHPWSETVQALRQPPQKQEDDHNTDGLSITELPLDDLDVETLNRIIMALLNTDDTARTNKLASAVHARTQGNAYFSLTFIENLREEGLLEFNLGTFQWGWDCQEILNATVPTTNTVSLLVDKIKRSTKRSQMTRLLPIAACLGSSFERKLLEIVWTDIEKVGPDFGEPEEHDKTDAQFDSILEMAMTEKFLESTGETHLRFIHDKIQEASMSLMRTDRFDKLKMCVGVVMLVELEPAELDSSVFIVVNLLNVDSLEGFFKKILMGDASKTTTGVASNHDFSETSYTHSHSTIRYSVENRKGFLRRLLGEVCAGDPHDESSSDFVPDLDDDEMDNFRVRVAQLNLQASVKAKGMSAFQSAAKYAAKGLALLREEEKWTRTFPLALELSNVGAEAEASIGNFDKAMLYVDDVIACPACSIADKIRAYRVLVAHKGGLGEMKEAADICLGELRRLGYNFPSNGLVKILRAIKVVIKMKRWKGLSLSEVAAKPIIADRNLRAEMALMEMACTLLYLIQDEGKMFLVIENMLRVTLKHGLCKETPNSLLLPAHICFHVFGDVKTGGAHVQSALTSLDRLGPYSSAAFSRTTWQIYGMLACWISPLTCCIPKLEEGYIRGLQVGDTESASINAWIMLLFELCSGKTTLDRLKQRCLAYIPQLEALQRFVFSKGIRSLLQLAINLSEEGTLHTTTLVGRAVDEDEIRRNADVEYDVSERLALYSLGFFKQMACVFFGDHMNGAELAIKRGDVILNELRGNALGSLCPALRAISLYAMARENTGIPRRKYKRLAKQASAKVRLWVKRGNVNLLHLLRLLEAEHKSLSKRKEAESAALYREARVLAARGGFRQDAALICERHSEFLLLACSEGRVGADRPGAARQMEEAIRYYSEWGAMNKANLLRTKYAALLVAQDWDQLAMALQQGVDVKTRTYRLRKYKDCFVGSEAVDFLSKVTARPREEALEIGRQMAERFNLLEHVCDKEGHPELEDGYLFYRFAPRVAFESERRTLVEVPW